jgi:NAD(P)-dependent dehydrogenase (short-subunit alcohol dehydrogenase family)
MRLSGCAVVVAPADGELTRAVVDAVEREGARVVVAASENPADTFDAVVRRHGRIDALVLTDAAIASPWLVAAGPALASVGGGAVTTIVTTRAFAGDANAWEEAAAGGAAVALTLALATTFGGAGVRANAVAVPPSDLGSEAVRRSTLLPRTFEGTDAAALVVFLSSADAGFVTGQCLRCDGGLLAHLPHFAAMADAGTTTTGG